MNCDKIIREAKYHIENKQYDSLQNLYTDLMRITSKEYRPNFEYIFQKIYLYACIKGDKEVIEWMKKIYDTFGDVEKIALKPTLIYGKYIFKN